MEANSIDGTQTEEPRVRDAAAARLGQRLRTARLARNMTQSEVAQGQFSVSYISAVERGQIRPSLSALERLSDRLQVSLSSLMADAEMPVPAALATQRIDDGAEHAEVEAKFREAQILSRQGKAQEALTLLNRVGGSLTPREQALLRWHRAFAHLELDRPEDAQREIAEAVPHAERANDPELTERLRLEMGNVYSLQHKHHLALDEYSTVLDAINHNVVRDPTFKLNVLYNLGNQYWHLGQHADAIEYLGRAAQMADEVLNPERLASVYYALSAALSAQGDARRARLYATRSLQAYEEAGNLRLAAQVYNRLGRAHAQSNQIGEALVYLQRAKQMADQQDDPRGKAEAQRSLASIYLQQGALDEARQAVDEAITLSEALSDPVQQGESLLVQGRLLDVDGHTSEAEQSFNRAVALLEETQSTQHLADALAQFSAFLENHGQGARALELLKRAWRLRDGAAL